MTKIDIFSGFLGAGKTTLIKKLLQEAYVGEKLVLIENEFGEIGIDGGFMKEAGITVNEMTQGCICCSLVGDFGEALKQVLNQYNPDRILIEPSGVGKLSDVIQAVLNCALGEITLNGVATVADANKCRLYMRNFGEFYNNQLQYANCIVLSRTLGLSEDKLQECVALLRTQNAEANIVTTPWEQLSGKQILAAMERKNSLETELETLSALQVERNKRECPVCAEHHSHEHEHNHDEHGHVCECGCEHEHDHDHECGCEHDHDHGHKCGCEHEHDHDHECGCEHEHDHDHECGCEHEHDHDHECGCEHEHDHDHHCGCKHDHGHDAHEVFTSWGKETARSFSPEELKLALEALEDQPRFGMVLRAKGIVNGQDGWLHFDYTPGEVNVRAGSADVIGRICVIGTELNQEALSALFKLA